MTVWESYLKANEAQLGTAVVVAPDRRVTGTAEDADNRLLLIAAQDGETITYFAGAGWTRSGDFADRAAWDDYVAAAAARLHHPLTLTLTP